MSCLCAGILMLSLAHLAHLPSSSAAPTMDDVIAGAMATMGAETSMDDMNMLANLEGTIIRQELDMMLTLDQYKQLYGLSDGTRSKRKAVTSETLRWTDKTVVYTINNNAFSTEDRDMINAAIDEWQTHTCIKFKTKTSNDYNYVLIDGGIGCQANVGMLSYPKQDLILGVGCRSKGVIIHEIGHTIGFYHEQNRPDRDDYVRINLDNIKTNDRHNFDKYNFDEVRVDVPYDYTSVMHYGGNFFSNNDQLTIETVDPAYQHLIGHRQGLSYHDIMMANRIYKCDEHCPRSTPCAADTYRGKDCKCYCKGPTENSPTQVCDGSGSVTTNRPIMPTNSPIMTTKRPPIERTTVVEHVCKDKGNDCKYFWVKFCDHSTLAQSICRKTCGRCDDNGVEKPSCTNKDAFCYNWIGFCGLGFGFVDENCPKTCGTCYPTDKEAADTYGDDPKGRTKMGSGATAHVEGSLVLFFGALVMSAFSF